MDCTCLLVNNAPQPGRGHIAKLGGGGMSLLGLLARLPETGWRPHVVVPGEGQFTDAARGLGVPVEVFPFQPLSARHPLHSMRDICRWLQVLSAVRPGLIHANGFELSRSFAPAAGLLHIPYVTHVRFPVDEQGARWTLRNLPKPAAFIFNSHAMHAALSPILRPLAPSSSHHVVHNAVDVDAFTPTPWPESPTLRLGMIANFAPFKRHEDFLRIAASMLRERSDLEFWVVGDDTEGSGRRAALERLAGELGIAKHVRFLGHRPDIPAVLSELHLLLVPSQFEPFGRVVIEAMAAGRPVVGSRDGGIPEIIQDGRTGFLRNVGDVEGFARAALALLRDRQLWQRMSHEARRDARDRFSLARHVRQIAEVYRTVLGNSRRRSA